MANKSSKAKATDKAFIDKHMKATKSAKVMDNQVAAAKSTATLHVVENTVDAINTAKSAGASRYKVTGAEFGFEVVDGMDKAKPEAAKYRVDPQHTKYATMFHTGDEASIATTLRSLSEMTANLQGMVACACAGLAARIQKEGKAALPLVNSLIDALEPLGKGLGFGRINAIRIWFTEMACLDYSKSQTAGEGKVFTINDKKRQKEAAKYGRNPDAWLAERISRPFWLVKPEKELGDFDFMAELAKLIERADKAEKKPEGFKHIDMTGFAEIKAAKATLRLVPKATEPTETTEDAANAA